MGNIKLFRLSLYIATIIVTQQASGQNLIQSPEQLDSLFLEYNDIQQPGIAAIVFYNDQLFYKKGFGASNLEHNVLIQNETKFRVVAIGKKMIALSLMTLVEEGSVALDDPITKYLPELKSVAEGIAIRNLIMHTSGLHDIQVLKELSFEIGMVFNQKAALDLISRQDQLEFIPGTRNADRSTNLFLLTLIIERITNSTFPEYVREKIFQPIEMNNSIFSFDENVILKNKADSYSIDKGITKLYQSNYEIFDGSNFYTTLNDLEKWIRFVLHPPAPFKNVFIKLDKPISLDINEPASLTTTTPTIGQELTYTNNGVPVKYQFGNDYGHSSSIYQFPEKGFTSVIVTNNNLAYNGYISYDIGYKVMPDYLKKIEPSDIKIDAYKHNGLDTFSGLYWNAEYGRTRKIFVKNDTLTSGRITANSGRSLIPLSENTFQMTTGYPVIFEFHTSKDSTKLSIKMNDHKEPGYILNSYPPPVYNKNDLRVYTGKFYSKHLDKFASIQLKESSLFLILEDKSEIKLIPHTKHMFLTEARYYDGIKFKIINDTVRFSISNNGAKDIWFSKI